MPTMSAMLAVNWLQSRAAGAAGLRGFSQLAMGPLRTCLAENTWGRQSAWVDWIEPHLQKAGHAQ